MIEQVSHLKVQQRLLRRNVHIIFHIFDVPWLIMFSTLLLPVEHLMISILATISSECHRLILSKPAIQKIRAIGWNAGSSNYIYIMMNDILGASIYLAYYYMPKWVGDNFYYTSKYFAIPLISSIPC